MENGAGAQTACLVGSAINGGDALRVAVDALARSGANHVSPYLLPNICANVPAGKAGTLLGFTGPVFSPQSACASGNHAIGLGARMLRDGDVDFALVGGVDMPLFPEIIHGFANMNATLNLKPSDRAYDSPGEASRPFSVDRKGFVLAEGGGILVLAAEDAMLAHGLEPRAEVAGIGWTSDACHYTRPNQSTIIRAMREAIDDAGIEPTDIGCVSAHGTSTRTGDSVEAACLREVFGAHLARLPISANKSQMGHTLGAAAAIEAAFAVEGLRRQTVLPTINHLPDPELSDLNIVTETSKHAHDFVLSDAFGFGGTNCCVVFKGV
jgi:3-oxoacyl-[acyl-carrier-protein] synthase II